jgi:cyclohexyl-isocyanide hydratase
VFASAGLAVHLAWKGMEPVRSATGLMLTPTVTLDGCPQLDVICIPGGGGVNALLTDGEVLDFVRRGASCATAMWSPPAG